MDLPYFFFENKNSNSLGIFISKTILTEKKESDTKFINNVFDLAIGTLFY